MTAQLVMAAWLGLTALRGGGPALTAEAQAYHVAAMASYDAGDLAGAVDLFERAYHAMPDPVAHRKGRSTVLGELRGTLLDLYDRSGDMAHLVRIHDLLVAHRDALLAGLGAAATPEDTVGVQTQIDELELQLERLSPPPLLPREPTVPPTPAAHTATPDPVAPLHPPEDAADRAARGRRRVGAALLGTSAVPLVAAAAALAVHLDRYRRIADLDHALDAAGRPATPAELARVDALGHQSVAARTTAIVTGTLGGVLLVAGVAVLATGRRPPSRVSVAPLLAPRAWGLGLTGRF